ncbi:unnamed protein product [Rhizophagus irregularis]|nr:unnamed protein product [Rhizophagus irregularis]
MSDLESIKGPESFQVPERSHSTLTNYKNLAYNILKNLNNELVKDKEISELRPCSECTMKVLTLLLKVITILLYLMEKVVKNALIQETEIGTCAKCSKKITLGFPKDTVFLSCKHTVHFNCIDNSNKRCPTYPVNLQLILTTQRRRTRDSFTEKTSRKKAKPLGKDNSSILKRLIQELSTDDSEDDISLQ